MTQAGIDKMEKAKWLLIDAREEATTAKEVERLERLIARIEAMQNTTRIR